jgi:hypothetical protein
LLLLFYSLSKECLLKGGYWIIYQAQRPSTNDLNTILAKIQFQRGACQPQRQIKRVRMALFARKDVFISNYFPYFADFPFFEEKFPQFQVI